MRTVPGATFDEDGTGGHLRWGRFQMLPSMRTVLEKKLRIQSCKVVAKKFRVVPSEIVRVFSSFYKKMRRRRSNSSRKKKETKKIVKILGSNNIIDDP